MTPPLLGALLLASCAPVKKGSPPKPFLYALASEPADKQGFCWVTLRNTRTGYRLWKRRIYDYDSRQVCWANNHRALLIEKPHDGFLIWRAGNPLLEVRYAFVPQATGPDYYDYCMGSVWSPDAKRLLLSFGMSGMGDMGYSRMFCLTLKGNRPKYTVLPSDSYVRGMGWRSNRIAFYRPAQGVGGQTTGKPRLWRVP